MAAYPLPVRQVLRSDSSLGRNPRLVRTTRAWITPPAGREVHGDQVDPEPVAVPIEVDDVVGADMVGCPEAGETLALPGGDSLRSDK
jgi:hypothetical protein